MVLIVSWIEDNLIIGKKAVEKTKKDLMYRFAKIVETLKSTWDTR